MKNLLEEVEELISEKRNCYIQEMLKELAELESESFSFLFWKRGKSKQKISLLRWKINQFDQFFNEEILFLAQISTYYFFNLSSPYYQVILNETEFCHRQQNKKAVMEYLDSLKRLLSFSEECFLSCIFDKNEAKKLSIDLEQKIILNQKMHISVPAFRESVEVEDPAIFAYLGLLLPEGLQEQPLKYQSIGDINFVSLNDDWNFSEYKKELQEWLILKELNNMIHWMDYEFQEEITKEILLKAKQHILLLFARLKDYSFELDQKTYIENFLASILVDITNNLINPNPQILKQSQHKSFC